MRNDIHSPLNFKPEDYVYVGSFDQYPEPGAFVSQSRGHYETEFGDVEALNHEHAEYLAARRLLGENGVHIHHSGDSDADRGHGCDHCGARIRYVSIFRHRPSNKVLAVGSICAAERFGCESRREYDVKRLKERSSDARERVRAFGKAGEFVAEKCPELSDWLLTPAAKDVHHIFEDMAHRLIKWGSLSDAQVEFARKLLRDHFERQRNGGRTDQQLVWDAEKAKAADCPEGRVEVIGKVVKTEVREGMWGTEFKMVVKDDRGFAVWTTIPDSLRLFQDGENQRALQKGDRIKFCVNLTRSDKDPKFGFGKRPAKACLVKS